MPPTSESWTSQWISRPVLIVIALLALALAACNSCADRPAQPTTACPASTLPGAANPATTAATSTSYRMVTEDPPEIDARKPNLTPDAGGPGDWDDWKLYMNPHNALSIEALTAPSLAANKAMLDTLMTAPLSSSLVAATDGRAYLAKDHASDLLKYVALCALDPGDAIEIPPRAIPSKPDALDPLRAEFPDGFPGELGLCGAAYDAWAKRHQELRPPPQQEPFWASAAPTAACRERVTSCVLARANRDEQQVRIALLGAGRDAAPKVTVETMLRDKTPIVSFQGCDALCLWGDPLHRNCDWEPRFVGQCEAGKTVSLSIREGHARIRACTGIYGCDSDDEGAGPLTAAKPPRYGGSHLEDGVDAIAFECPANGPMVDGKRTGYYGIMVAAAPGSTARPTDVALVASNANGTYPATEEDVFTYREAAFYGTLFPPVLTQLAAPVSRPTRPGPRKPLPAVEPAPPAPCPDIAMFPGNQFVCYSKLWSKGMAMANDRFCAGPDSRCFVQTPKNCDQMASGPGVGTAPAPLKPDREVYNAADGGATSWPHPHTVYLNNPCDLLDPAECKNHLDPTVWASLPDVVVDPPACPALDLPLSTGFADAPPSLIADGQLDDTWRVVASPDGTLGPPHVVTFASWSTPAPPPAPSVKWVTPWPLAPGNTQPDVAAPSGVTTYEACFCLDEGFRDPRLDLTLRADNLIQAVRVNGCTLPGASGGPHNSTPLEVETSDSSCFQPGQNCVRVDVQNAGTYAGFFAAGGITATGGTCCP